METEKCLAFLTHTHTNPFCVNCVVVVERKKRLGLIKPRFTADEFVNELIWKIWLCVWPKEANGDNVEELVV
jgi:hypothetical protein